MLGRVSGYEGGISVVWESRFEGMSPKIEVFDAAVDALGFVLKMLLEDRAKMPRDTRDPIKKLQMAYGLTPGRRPRI
jgi:hypothetical protein